MNSEEKILEVLQGITTRLDRLETKVDQQKDDILHEVGTLMTQQKVEIMHEVGALIEAAVIPKFNLLADGQKLIREQMVKQEDLGEKMEDINTRLDLLEAITRRNVREIEKLKKAQ